MRPSMHQAMHTRPITDQQFADILDEAEVLHRADFGMLMTTTGRHPELGGFVVTQSVAGFDLASELMPVTDGLCGPEHVLEALYVLGCARRAATRVDRLGANGQG